MYLAIDFGSTHTVGMLGTGDSRGRPLLFDGTPLLPSCVFAHVGGMLSTGADAARLGRTAPERFEPAPKSRIDDGVVLLGEQEWPVADLIAAVLSRVAQEAGRVAGTVPPVALTYPAAWGPQRRSVLRTAAERAGLDVSTMVAEPVAAATAFARLQSAPPASGSALAVFDFGGGTLDLAVIVPGEHGLDVAATAGIADLGGADLDAALAAMIGRAGGHPIEALSAPQRRDLLDQARAAKETLSRATVAEVHLPWMPATHVTRDQFEALARPLLAPGVDLTARTFAGLDRAGAAVPLYLVGGASRIPLVATVLHARLGAAPVVLEQPELVVADGALQAMAWQRGTPTTTTATTTTAAAVPSAAAPPAGRGRGVPRPRRTAAAAALLVVGLAAAVLVWQPWDRPEHGPAAGPSAGRSSGPSSAPSRPVWPIEDVDLSVHALPGNDPDALPELPKQMSGWSLARETSETIRLYDGTHRETIYNLQVPANHCGQLRYLVTWRTVGQRRVRAQFVDPVDGTEPQGPAAEGGSGWMAATTCAQPSWLDVDTDAQGMIDIAVHYQEWSVA